MSHRCAASPPLTGPDGTTTPVVAGVVTAVVGFTSSFAVVLAGLTTVGASPEQAASGLLTLCVLQGLGMLWLVLRHRTPITLAWSTPGAALLVATGAVAGGWPAAVGAFAVTGLLILATGLVPRLGDLVAAIPVPLAQAMLAGVLLPLCLAPVTALAASPALVAPVVLAWLVMLRLSRRWAAPVALLVALAVVLVTVLGPGGSGGLSSGTLLPSITWTAPHWSVQAVVSIALPLYVVTMASQNVPGVAVMRGYGFTVPWRESMSVTGVATVLGAGLGGHAVNLAAITAALAAGPSAGVQARRWIAALTAALVYLVLAALCPLLAALVAAAPDGVVQAAAGLALLGTLGAALGGALRAEEGREAAVATFVVAASGVSVLGVGAAFWALVVGLVVRAVVPRVTPRTAPDSTPDAAPDAPPARRE